MARITNSNQISIHLYDIRNKINEAIQLNSTVVKYSNEIDEKGTGVKNILKEIKDHINDAEKCIAEMYYLHIRKEESNSSMPSYK